MNCVCSSSDADGLDAVAVTTASDAGRMLAAHNEIAATIDLSESALWSY